MSSNCPPQLQLSLQPNTTSFKRSFEQFGFDLESPVAGGITDAGASGATNNPGNERNKRARSASSFDSESSSDLSSESIASGSTSFSSQVSGVSVLSALVEPPRLPTPQLQDVDMEEEDSFSPPGAMHPVSPPQTHVQDEGDAQHGEQRYRLALERFDLFDREISILRQPEAVSSISTLTSSSSVAGAPSAPGNPHSRLSPTPVPTLPPLPMNRHRLSPSDIAFFHRTSPLAAPWHENEQGPMPRDSSDQSRQHAHHTTFAASSSPSDAQVFTNQNGPFRYLYRIEEPLPLSMPTLNLELNLGVSIAAETTERSPSSSSSFSASIHSPLAPISGADDLRAAPARFRERLDTALERLRSPSPLVPGLRVDDENHSDEQDEEESSQASDEDDDERENEPVSRTDTHISTAAPILPPIPPITGDSPTGTVLNISTDATNSAVDQYVETQIHTQRHTRNTPAIAPSPPTLPPIPTITTNIDTTERAWDGRAELFTDNFDEFMGLGSASVSPSTSTAPGSAFEGETEFNLNFGDGPSIPSPILRDLRSWMDDRQPPIPAEDNQSISSISTTAATAGTERDITRETWTPTVTMPTAGPSSPSPSSSSSPAPSLSTNVVREPRIDPIQEQLERLRGRRLEPDGWLPDIRPPSASTSSWNLSARSSAFNSHPQQRNPPPLHTDRDLLHLSDVYDETSPTLSASPPGLSGDAFWAPLFAAADEAPRAVTPSVRPLYPARQRPFVRHAVRTSDQGFGLSTGLDGPPAGTSERRFTGITEHRPRVAGSSVADVAYIVEDRSRSRRDATNVDVDTMEVPGIPQPTSSTSPSSDVNADPPDRDHMSYTSIMQELSQPRALDLDLTSNLQSSRLLTTSDQVAQPTSAGVTQTRERLMQERNVIGRTAERMPEHERRIFAGLGRIDGTPREPAASGLWADTRFAMNNLFASSGNYYRPRSPSRSSLSNWDGRSAAQANPRSQSQSPTRVFSFHSSSNPSAPIPSSRDGLSPDANREETNIRNRFRSQHAHTRPGASNSLVTENASEVRRRADLEALNSRMSTRQYPSRDEDDSSTLAGDVRVSSYETSWLGLRHDLRRSSQAHSQVHDGTSDISMASIESSTPSSHLPASSSSVTTNTGDEHMDVFDSGDGLVPLPSLGTFINTMPLDTTSNNAGGSAASPTGSNFPILGPYWTNHSTRLAPSSYPGPGNSSIPDNSPTFPQRAETLPSTSLPNERRPLDGNNRQYNIPGVGASSTQRYQSDAPSLPHPDLGGAFNAHRHQRSTSSQWRPTEDAPVDVIMEETPQTADGLGRANADNETASSPELDESAHPPRLQHTFMRDRQREVSRVRERLYRSQALQQHTMDRNIARNNATAIAATTTNLTASTPTEPLVPRRIIPHDIFVPRAGFGPSQRRNPSATPALPAYFDPETFTPGPFRSTMQQYVNEREGRSDSIAGARLRPRPTTQAPLIPPLPFAAEGGTTTLSSPSQGDSDEEMLTDSSFLAIQARIRARERQVRASEAHSSEPHLMPHARYTPRSRSAAVHEFEARLPGLSSASTANESNVNDTAARRNLNSRLAAQSDERIDSVYQYVTQRARMEASTEQSPAGSLPLPPRGRYLQIQAQQNAMLRLHENADRRRPDPAERPPTSADTRLSRVWRASGLFDSMGTHVHARPAGGTGESSASAAASSADDDDDMTGGEAAQRTRNRRRFTRNPHAEMPFSLAHAHGAGALMGGMRRGRPLSDYIRDEEFDESYESLLTLAETLGDAKPRATPSEILEKMEKATYKDWATEESDTRCPICLDDYEQTDLVLKLTNCSHWLHQGCLNQWLQSANTCPVCRCSVGSSSSPRTGPAARMPRYRGSPFTFMARRREPPPVPASLRPEASVQRQFRGGRPQPSPAQAHAQAHLQAHVHTLRNGPPHTASAPTSPATPVFPANILNSRRPRDRSGSGSGSSAFEVPWRREPGPH